MKHEITLETMNKPGRNCLADMLGLEILQIDGKK